MTRRLTNITTYNFANYSVALERIKNDINGNPRYKAIIIRTNEAVTSSAVYTFSGHYMGERQEAEWILERYLEEAK